jgi:hypothetical protein
MKKTTRVYQVSNLEKRRKLLATALPEVRKLVSRYDLASIQGAVKTLYNERQADKELRLAEAKVEALKKKLSK